MSVTKNKFRITRTLRKHDQAQVVVLAVGEQFWIDLDENPSTGFLWHLKPDKGMAVIVSEYYPNPEGKVGGGGLRRFVMQAEKSGAYIITAKQHKPWENEQNANEVLNFCFRVH